MPFPQGIAAKTHRRLRGRVEAGRSPSTINGNRARGTGILAKRIRRIVEAIAEGVPARSLKDELMALEQRQDELEREIARGPLPQPLLHPNLAELYRQKVAELHTALEHPTHAAEGWRRSGR
jgi:hypothetical protein